MEGFPAHLKTSRKSGYSVIELMIVMGIMALLMGAGWYAFRRFEHYSELRNAQRELVSRLQAARNEAFSGVIRSGATMPTHQAYLYSGYDYQVDGSTYLHNKFRNVRIISIGAANPILICFFHPSQDTSDPSLSGCSFSGNDCGHFACDGGTPIGGTEVRITLEHTITTATQVVVINGQGQEVLRIYED